MQSVAVLAVPGMESSVGSMWNVNMLWRKVGWHLSFCTAHVPVNNANWMQGRVNSGKSIILLL